MERVGPGVDLTGRTVLITGAASGIGKACARAFAGTGAELALADRDEAGLKAAAGELGGTPYVVDLAQDGAVDALPETVDVVVNNAGLQHVAPVHEFPPERFTHMHRVMVLAPFLILRRTLPGMYDRRWGRVINIGSVHGRRASAYKSAYVSAKHAVEGLSKVVAVEGGPYGVTSNCIDPGYVRTPLVERQIQGQAELHGIPEKEVIGRVLLQRSVIKRLVEPEEVADAAVWLCSGAARSVTGTSLTMDGGWTAT